MSKKVTVLEGGKKDVVMCMHCGVFPAEDHPGNSCPRIAAVSSDAWEYVDLHTWERWLEGHGMSIPGIKDEE